MHSWLFGSVNFRAQGWGDATLTSATFTSSRIQTHLRPDQEGTKEQHRLCDTHWSIWIGWVFCLPFSQYLTTLADIKARPRTSILRYDWRLPIPVPRQRRDCVSCRRGWCSVGPVHSRPSGETIVTLVDGHWFNHLRPERPALGADTWRSSQLLRGRSISIKFNVRIPICFTNKLQGNFDHVSTAWSFKLEQWKPLAHFSSKYTAFLCNC